MTIKNFIKLGWLKKDVAEEMKCHRNTVTNIVKENPVKEKINRLNQKHPLDEHKGFIQEWLDKKLSLVRIHEELIKEKNYQKGYDTLRKYAKSRDLKPAKVYMVLHAKPGEEAQVDFGYVGMTLDDTGKMRKTYVFAMILSHSRKGFHTTVYDQRVETFIECFIEAFEYFSGIPEKVKIDNLKAAILKANFYEPEYQKEYQYFAEVYGFIPMPCKVRQPQEKGKVESGIKYVKNNFFKGRKFKSETDLKYQLQEWQEKICNQRIHGTTKKVPEIVFQEIEKNKLKALPDKRWETFRLETRKVSSTCHIIADRNYYSVPYKYVGKTVQVKIGKNVVKIFFNNQQITIHQKLSSQGEYQTDRMHYPGYKALSQTEYQFKQSNKMKEIGEHAYHYFQKIIKQYPDHWGKKIAGIIHLSKQYGNKAVDLSCQRALQYEVYSYHVIANICRKGLFREPTEIEQTAKQSPKSSLACPRMGERPLSYYSQLFISLTLIVWNMLITLCVL